MASYQDAENARDAIASAMLDGINVVSVGIAQATDGYGVGVTATHPVDFRRVDGLHDNVEVMVRLTSSAPQAHSGVSWWRTRWLRKLREALAR